MAKRALSTGFASADDSPGFLLWQVTNRWQGAQRAALKPFGLTHVQFVLLASLTWLQGEGPITQVRLAEHASTGPMMTSQVLRALERRHLVARTVHPADKRAQLVTATESGQALVNRAIVAVEACDRRFFQPIGGAVPDLIVTLRALR